MKRKEQHLAVLQSSLKIIQQRLVKTITVYTLINNKWKEHEEPL